MKHSERKKLEFEARRRARLSVMKKWKPKRGSTKPGGKTIWGIRKALMAMEARSTI